MQPATEVMQSLLAHGTDHPRRSIVTVVGYHAAGGHDDGSPEGRRGGSGAPAQPGVPGAPGVAPRHQVRPGLPVLPGAREVAGERVSPTLRLVSPPAQQHHAVAVAVTCTAASAPAHRRTWHKPDCNFAHPRWASGEYENWTPDSGPILNQGGGNHAHLDVCSRYVLCCKTCFSQVGLSDDCFANPYSGKIGAKSAPASLHLSCGAARRLSNGSLAVLHRFYACAKCQCRIL